MGMPSVAQLLIILVIVVLIFGAKRLKNLGGDLGSAVKGFKEAIKDEDIAKAELEDDSVSKQSQAAEATIMNNKEEEPSIKKPKKQKSS